MTNSNSPAASSLPNSEAADETSVETGTENGVDPSKRPRRGAAGKALLVYLGTGSIGAALIAYLVFHQMGC